MPNDEMYSPEIGRTVFRNLPEGTNYTFRNVYIADAEDLYDYPVIDIRLKREEPYAEWPAEKKYRWTMEAQVFCRVCQTPNWVVFGTDPGDYRCANGSCTEWL